MKYKMMGAGALLLALAAPAWAESKPVRTVNEKHSLEATLSASDGAFMTWLMENDAFGAKTDKNYTTGSKAHYRARPGQEGDFETELARRFFGAEARDNVFMTWAIGQSIYTPDDTKSSRPVPNQHPYAGWLYGEAGLHIQDSDFRGMTAATLNVGIAGPLSFAEETQRAIHDVLGQGSPDGWDNQIKNELGVMFSLERRWRHVVLECFESGVGESWIGRQLGIKDPIIEADIISMVGGTAGNVLTEAQAGAMLRIGFADSDRKCETVATKSGNYRHGPLAQDWGAVRVRPGYASPGPRSYKYAPDFQLWTGLQFRAQAQNIFLDGNTFQDSLSVDKFPIVADWEFGVSTKIPYLNGMASFVYVVRSEEFRMQDGYQNFGVISLGFNY